MSQVWHRMRGLANPVPAVEPGGIEQEEWDPGGDVQLPDDHFSRLHNPQNGRVPPQLPSPPSRPQWPQFPELQYERFFTETPFVPFTHQLGFTAQSVRIDNFSCHWLFLPAAGMYVPPFTYGSIYPLSPGTPVAAIVQQAPRNLTDASPVLESTIISIWYENMLMPTSGVVLPSTFRSGVVGGTVLNSNLAFSPDNTYSIGTAISGRPYGVNIGSGGLTIYGGGTVLAFGTDNVSDIGGSGSSRPRNVFVAGQVVASASGEVMGLITGGGIQIGMNLASSALFSGTGAPPAGNGANGDFYFRQDTPGTSLQRIYVKSAGAWVGIV